MAKLDEQIKTMAGYLAAGCEPEGRLTVGLEVEHFITRTDGSPVSFPELQQALRELQRQTDAPIIEDSAYMGYRGTVYTAQIGPACQLAVGVAPQREVQELLDLYNRYYLQLGLTLAEHGLRAWTLGYHPTRRAEELALIPRERDMALDRYFRTTGDYGSQFLRATAATRISIDYFSEQDFVRKLRAACLLTPFFALLCDNTPVYQGSRTSGYTVRTRIRKDVDNDRFGIPPHLMEPDFGFARYAQNVLARPQVVALRMNRAKAVGTKTAQELYGSHLSQREAAQVLSMFFYDARLKSRIELCVADSMPPPYIAAYAQLVKSVFGSPAALQNVLRHYGGASTLDIMNAKLAVCKDGFSALVYGKPVGSELAWLLMQARSRTPSQEERALLAPFMRLVTARKTIRELGGE